METIFILLLALIFAGGFLFRERIARGKGLTDIFVVITTVLILSGCAELEPDSELDTKQDSTPQTDQKVQQHSKDSQENQAETNKNNQNTESAKPVQTAVQKSEQKTSKDTKGQVPVELSRSVDGDTIKVYYKGKEETVRYLLVDTPESKKPGTCVQPFAESAGKRNNQLVRSGKLTLEFEKSQKDKYGRLLAYVFVDGKSVQETLLKEGYARLAYIYEPPYKYMDRYEDAEQTAENQGLNIWSRKGIVTNRGFNGCASSKDADSTRHSQKKPAATPAQQQEKEQVITPQAQASAGKSEYFQNCTELRKTYPNGVPSTHPAYQDKMDRDKDNYACER